MNLLIDNIPFCGLLFFALVSCLSTAAQNVATVLLLLYFIIKAIIEKKRPTLEDSLTKGIALFFAATAISAVFAINKQTSIEVWFNYLYRFSIFFVAAFSIKTRKQVLWILNALVISISITDLYAIWQWLNGMERVSGFFSHPMFLAGGLIMTMPYLFLQVLENREHRYIFIPALILSLFTLLINQTRGAWIAIGVTAIFCSIFLKQYRKQIVIGITILLILILFFFGASPQLTARFQTIFDIQYQSNSERILVWNSAIQMVIDYPLTGIGLGNFQEQYTTKYISPFAKEHLWHAHNTVLHIFAETGIIGGVAFLYMFYIFFKNYYFSFTSKDTWKSSMAVIGLLVVSTLLLQGITEYIFANSVVTRLFWFVSGVLYASTRLKGDC
jgi:O-antigen ligase